MSEEAKEDMSGPEWQVCSMCQGQGSVMGEHCAICDGKGKKKKRVRGANRAKKPLDLGLGDSTEDKKEEEEKKEPEDDVPENAIIKDGFYWIQTKCSICHGTGKCMGAHCQLCNGEGTKLTRDKKVVAKAAAPPSGGGDGGGGGGGGTAVWRSEEGWVKHTIESITAYYDIGLKLGEGAFGSVMKGRCKEKNEDRAIKIMSKKSIGTLPAEEKKSQIECLKKEIHTIRQMNHPNIVKLFQVYETHDDVYLILEYLGGGNLITRLENQSQGKYTEEKARHMIKQVADGLRHIHQHDIAHCDLKPQNLVFADNDDDSRIVIIDFGMAKHTERRKYFTQVAGSAFYIAPEVLSGHYTTPCDLWSLGVLTFVLMYGFPPFCGFTNKDVFESIKKGFKADEHFRKRTPGSDDVKDLIKKLLVIDAAKRLTAIEVLEHKWFSQNLSEAPLLDGVVGNLLKMGGNSKLKTHILSHMTNELSREELDDLKKNFQAVDKDGGGTISTAELKEVLSSSNMSEEDLCAVVQLADADGDGQISYDELVNCAIQKKLTGKEERLWKVFRDMDLNKDGKLSPDELKQALGKEDDEVRELIAEVDADGDGCIDYQEFVGMWARKDGQNIWKDDHKMEAPDETHDGDTDVEVDEEAEKKKAEEEAKKKADEEAAKKAEEEAKQKAEEEAKKKEEEAAAAAAAKEAKSSKKKGKGKDKKKSGKKDKGKGKASKKKDKKGSKKKGGKSPKPKKGSKKKKKK